MSSSALPDVTSELHADKPHALQWVGMENIAVPIQLEIADQKAVTIAAKANVFVSLDALAAKGIHMSRLHLALNTLAQQTCNKATLNALLSNFIHSQQGISNSAKIELQFELILQKPALLSDEFGYQSYPLQLSAEQSEQGFSQTLGLSIPYSSTCPCSAALSRQLYADAVEHRFSDATIDKHDLLNWIRSEAGSIATPHSQRSNAHIELDIGDAAWPDLALLIFELEEMIATAVQTAVKRQDEQAFAQLNANNLMFCEDAARRLKHCLDQMPLVQDYRLKIEHLESLHAHNAVVRDQKRSSK